ncbi:MAG: DUF4276 family protein [Deltaproteobacteria bacterium]|nr:DUF4276 family protein [Deltaproteobacteria bacterium]
MDENIPIVIAVEDDLSEAVLRVMFNQSTRSYEVSNCLGRQGSGYLKKKIKGFNQAAKGIPFLVLTDLDQTDCPPLLIGKWLSIPKHENLLFRIAVREIESWLLAHRRAMASFFGVQENLIPSDPDNLSDPKRFLISLAAKSRKSDLRKAIVPANRSTAKIGPDYNGTLVTFVRDSWQAKEASKSSPSLRRAFNAIEKFTPVYAK